MILNIILGHKMATNEKKAPYLWSGVLRGVLGKELVGKKGGQGTRKDQMVISSGVFTYGLLVKCSFVSRIVQI